MEETEKPQTEMRVCLPFSVNTALLTLLILLEKSNLSDLLCICLSFSDTFLLFQGNRRKLNLIKHNSVWTTLIWICSQLHNDTSQTDVTPRDLNSFLSICHSGTAVSQ